MNQYKTIDEPVENVIQKEKKSKFIGFAYPVDNMEDIKSIMTKLKKSHPTANHHCYAYEIGLNSNRKHRYSDDGEPNNSAGLPIYRQIQSLELTNTLVVVVRYFGGVKLGVPGLIRSYKTAAADSISKAIIITKTIKEQYEVHFKYPQMNDVMRLVKEFNLVVINTDFQIECKLIFAVAKSKAENVKSAFKNNHKITIEYLKTI